MTKISRDLLLDDLKNALAEAAKDDVEASWGLTLRGKLCIVQFAFVPDVTDDEAPGELAIHMQVHGVRDDSPPGFASSLRNASGELRSEYRQAGELTERREERLAHFENMSARSYERSLLDGWRFSIGIGPFASGMRFGDTKNGWGVIEKVSPNETLVLDVEDAEIVVQPARPDTRVAIDGFVWKIDATLEGGGRLAASGLNAEGVEAAASTSPLRFALAKDGRPTGWELRLRARILDDRSVRFSVVARQLGDKAYEELIAQAKGDAESSLAKLRSAKSALEACRREHAAALSELERRQAELAERLASEKDELESKIAQSRPPEIVSLSILLDGVAKANVEMNWDPSIGCYEGAFWSKSLIEETGVLSLDCEPLGGWPFRTTSPKKQS